MSEMSAKSIVLLLLLLIVTQVTECDDRPMDYTCTPASTRLMNCSNNPRIRVAKSEEIYQLIILCTNNQCTENITINFECRDICEVCGILTGQPL
jgi:hypothetical protein